MNKAREKLMILLRGKGVDRGAIAEKCGVTKSAVGNWINGSHPIPANRFAALIDFFGASPADIYGHSETERSELETELSGMSKDDKELLLTIVKRLKR